MSTEEVKEKDAKKKSRVSMMVKGPNKPMDLMEKSSVKLAGKSMSRMRMRRMSYGFGGVAGIKAVKNTQIGAEFQRPPLLYLSTYQLDPHPNQVFDVQKVTNLVETVLNILWSGHTYNVTESPALALRISGELMRRVKNMNFNRYRIISVVTIGQKRSQSYNNAIAFLWDHERDNYVDVQKECTTNFIQCTIFGIYLD